MYVVIFCTVERGRREKYGVAIEMRGTEDFLSGVGCVGKDRGRAEKDSFDNAQFFKRTLSLPA